MAFLERCLQCFGGMWHFGGACSVYEGCGILEVLAMFWRDVAFWRCLQCFGGCGIFEAVLAVFRRGVAFLRRCLQCFGGAL